MKYFLEKNKSTSVKFLETDEHKITDPVHISETFNGQISQIGSKLVDATESRAKKII